MEQTFLQQSAAHIFNKYQADLQRVTVVLPTNRACYFFKRALAMQTDQPFWSPAIVPIDDFIAQTADAEPVDPIQLLWLLFDTCRETDPNIQFDKFTSWAYTLLQDFDHIDQYLVNTKELFEYLSEAKTLERWQPDLPGNGTPQPPTTTLKTYFKLWDNLQDIYRRLKQKLAGQGKGYRGMLYRRIAENMNLLLDNEAVVKYVFIGFNALSRSEEQILSQLVKRGKGEILWDTDDYYMDANLNVKAGDTLRHYRDENNLGEWNWQTNHLQHQPKDIHIIGVANASMQAKVAMQIYRKQLLDRQKAKANGQVALEFAEPDVDENVTAIVLPDENLLLPLLQSLPAEVKDFNVTMGLALKNSGLYTLVEALFDLQHLHLLEKRDGQKTLKFNHRYVTRILTHPFIRQYDYVHRKQINESGEQNRSLINNVLHEISFNNKIFLTPDEIILISGGHPLFETLFTPWQGESQAAMGCFYELIDHLRQVYQDRKDALETEYLYLFRQLMQRLDDIMRERAAQQAETLSLRSFRLFLNELFRQTKIPFSGEPVSNLQIMGMLETRTLDFETVILLSVNEKVLPQGKKQQSLIPFDANFQFGLPTYRTQEAVMSYHFYRLIQRPSSVYLLYVLPSDTYGGKGEKSRFIQQIENELIRYNPNIKLHYHDVQVAERGLATVLPAFEVGKTEEIRERMLEKLSKGLYPSHLNTFVECSMKYYLSQVLNLRLEDEAGESLDRGQFGDLVHRTLEGIDREMADSQQATTKEDLEKWIPQLAERVRAEFVNAYPDYNLESGQNHLLYKVAVRMIGNFFTEQIENGPFPMEILGLEKEIFTDYQTFVRGEPVHVRLTGKIDRVDRIGSQIRIIDYKTGKIEKKQLRSTGPEQEDLLLHKPEGDKIRQLWLYKYIVAKKMVQDKGIQLAHKHLAADQHQLIAGIFSFRNLKEGLLEEHLEIGTDATGAGTLESFVQHSEDYLHKLIHQLLDAEKPFERTTNVKICTRCDYRTVCGR